MIQLPGNFIEILEKITSLTNLDTETVLLICGFTADEFNQLKEGKHNVNLEAESNLKALYINALANWV